MIPSSQLRLIPPRTPQSKARCRACSPKARPQDGPLPDAISRHSKSAIETGFRPGRVPGSGTLTDEGLSATRRCRLLIRRRAGVGHLVVDRFGLRLLLFDCAQLAEWDGRGCHDDEGSCK